MAILVMVAPVTESTPEVLAAIIRSIIKSMARAPTPMVSVCSPYVMAVMAVSLTVTERSKSP